MKLEVYGKIASLIIYIDIIRTIRDPEEPGTLEELKMVNEDFVSVRSKIAIEISPNIEDL